MASQSPRITPAYRAFLIFNICFLILTSIVCLFPLLNVLAVSFSSNGAVARGIVYIFPVDFTTVAYNYLMKSQSFWRSMLIAFERLFVQTSLALIVTIMCAYALSKQDKHFKARKYYVWFIMFTMLFSGGLIPTFLVIKYTGLLGSFWSMVIPALIGPSNVVLLLNFFRQLPEELEEAAFMDGATQTQTLIMIILPLSKAALATVSLFMMVWIWNEWFTPILYLKDTADYPLQAYLRTIILQSNFQVTSMADVELLNKMSNRTLQSAQIFIGMLPILVIYPFLQKYFTKGIVLGSVKG